VFVRDRSRASSTIDKSHHQPTPWIGQPAAPDQVVTENGPRFIIRPYEGFSVGLFLEHRDNRGRIGELAAGRRVLNAFAYTCGFSVAAAVGGATSVDSVDLSKRYLEWGKRNFDANGIDASAHRFFCSDISDFWRRAARQGRRYDLIVLDPPTFARRRRPHSVFVLDEQLEALCSGAAKLLDPGGLVLLATNCRSISRGRLEEALTAAASDRSCAVLERPGLPIDFAGDPDYSKAVIARFD
jgi:23S rRNA (cytosine1962-C5)-methyltransferase